MIPIPLIARPHAVGIVPCTGLDVQQRPVWGAETAFPRVKVQLSSGYDGSVDASLRQTGVCYIDASDAPASPDALQKASLSAGHAARLIWQGTAYLIDQVTPVHQPSGAVHHWKVTFQ
ncbi:MAG: hypothetical protein ACI4O7_08170 [Aristaeellaceae bacterium]